MMKFVVLLALLVLAMGQQQQCRQDSDCEADHCCVSSMLHLEGRKRLLFDDIFEANVLGKCMPLAQHGHTCEPDLLTFGGSRAHSFGCPCAGGLECHGQQESHQGGSHSYTNPTCVPPRTQTGAGTTHGSSGTTAEAEPAGTQIGTETTLGSWKATTEAQTTELPVTHPATTQGPDPDQPVHEVPGK